MTAVPPESGAAAEAEPAPPSVASVRVDSSLPHLDRPFDYVVPKKLLGTVAVGSRVRVPFAGRLTNAVVVGLSASSQFEGKLSQIRSTGATPSFTGDAIGLAERVARRYGGAVWDVLRLMAPPRVAAVEKREWHLPLEMPHTDATDPYEAALDASRPQGDEFAPSSGVADGPPAVDSEVTGPEPTAAALPTAAAGPGPVTAAAGPGPVTAAAGPGPVMAPAARSPLKAPAAGSPLTAPAAPGRTLDSESSHLDRSLLAGPGDRVIWEALPETEPRTSIPAKPLIAEALRVAATGASAVLVVPDARAIAALLAECERHGLRRWTARSGGEVAVLDHDDGPAVRFGNYLAAMHGHARIVLGTRLSALQPVPKLGLIAVWDEANGALEDPHAPYPHARTVAAMRAEDGACLILGGYALSAEAVALVEHGWARLVSPARDQVRNAVPAVDILTAERRDAEGGSGWHWLPGSVWRILRKAVADGPVAVIVPRAGYVRATACAKCEAWAECRDCDSLLGLPSPGADPVCLDQNHPQPDWHCPECQGNQLKHVRQGAERIAEQLDRMLGEIPLTVSSTAAGIVPDHQVTHGVVLATPAALPAVAGGYRHLAVVDAGVPTGLGLGGELKAIRWWLNAAALVRSRRDGGAVSVIGEVPPAVRRALSTWAPAEAALAEYQERSAIGLPPHRRYLTVHGSPEVTAHALERAGLRQASRTNLGSDSDRAGSPPGPHKANPLQPALATGATGTVTEIALDGGVGILLPRSRAQAAVDSLRESVQAASKAGHELRLRVDGPLELPR